MIVIDASVLAPALGDDGADGDLARLRLLTERDLAAPELVDIETVSVLRRGWLSGAVDDARFEAAVIALEHHPIQRYASRPFLRRAHELRANVTPYDALYVALAERLRCPLLTLDARLAAAPGVRCPVEVLAV